MLSQKNICQKSVKKNSKFSKADQHDGRVQIWNKWFNTYEVRTTPSSKVFRPRTVKTIGNSTESWLQSAWI